MQAVEFFPIDVLPSKLKEVTYPFKKVISILQRIRFSLNINQKVSSTNKHLHEIEKFVCSVKEELD